MHYRGLLSTTEYDYELQSTFLYYRVLLCTIVNYCITPLAGVETTVKLKIQTLELKALNFNL